MTLRSILTALVALATGCTPAPMGRVDETFSHPDRAPLSPFDSCTVYTAREPSAARDHRAPCSTIDYPFDPPAGGPHYSVWANFLVYDAPVPWGFLVHSLEHGAVVLAYDPDTLGAPALRTALVELANAHGLDPLCRDEEWPNRIIVVPDPDLEWPIAARAWEHVYDATCLDPESLAAFVALHYGRAPEDFCFPGTDLTSTGWCP